MGQRDQLKTHGEWDLLIFGDYKYLDRASHGIKTGLARRRRRTAKQELHQLQFLEEADE